jgi:SAM-dependent methyltransferase
MFDGHYLEREQKRIKAILEAYTPKFFYFKTILDLGAGYAGLSGCLHRLGADITCVDARQEHLKIITKKYQGIKVVKADLDGPWPFGNKKFDLIIDLDLVCHLNDYEKHLREVCKSTTHLILETAVCDSDDPEKSIQIKENKGIYDLSYNGIGSRPSVAAIERVLAECGMNFRRIDQDKLNGGEYTYNWEAKNNGECNVNKRRMWLAVSNGSGIKFKGKTIDPIPLYVEPEPVAPVQYNEIPKFALNQNNNNVPLIDQGFAPNFTSGPNKRFVIVIPSYKNEKWCETNINSAIMQNYENYRIIFVDDCSQIRHLNWFKIKSMNPIKKKK